MGLHPSWGCSTELQNHILLWVGRALQAHPVPTPWAGDAPISLAPPGALCVTQNQRWGRKEQPGTESAQQDHRKGTEMSWKQQDGGRMGQDGM